MTMYLLDNTVFSDSQLESRIPKDALSVYEVVKVIKGVPLFLEEHVQRLHHSTGMINKSVPFEDTFINEKIKKLIELNQIDRGRIKFVIVFHPSGNHFYAQQAEDIEPTPEQYTTGIKIKSLKIERHNPEAKVINTDYNQAVSGIKEMYNVYEVLLIKADGKVTEGSRSNIFFIKDNIVYTSQSKDVLSGITRVHVFEICKQNQIPIVEQDIFLDQINQFDSAFITGTSPGILPVSEIDGFNYKVENAILQLISKDYLKEAEDYIQLRSRCL
jgi:branched-chain amino acid aminotransferase